MENSIQLNGKIEVKFGWDAYPRQYSGGLIGGLTRKPIDIDCDAGLLLCGKDKKPISGDLSECYVNYENSRMFENAILHYGDNTTGGDLDDEIIFINLDALPAQVESIIFTLDLFKEKKKIGTGKIQNTFVRIVLQDTKEEFGRCDFSNLGGGTKLVECGMLYRVGTDRWTFQPLKSSYNVKNVGEYVDKVRFRN